MTAHDKTRLIGPLRFSFHCDQETNKARESGVSAKLRKRVPKAYAQKIAVLYALHQLAAGTGATEARVRRKPYIIED